MRRDWGSLVIALASATTTIINGQFAWGMTQSPDLVRRALDALIVTFFFWMPILLVIVSAPITFLLLVFWWRGKPIPNRKLRLR